MIAVILESGARERVYTALSLLVSTAAAGEPARGLVSFGALPALLAGDFGDDLLGRSLTELLATAGELDDCRLWACAAATDVTGAAAAPPLEGVMSTPRFLSETAGARLVVV